MNREPMSMHGYNKICAELKQLKEVERPNIVKEIDIARGHGDLKENAEYHAAKEKQRFIEARIVDLSEIISNAQVIDPGALMHNKVSFGSTIKILNLDNDKEFSYTIVGSVESDPAKGLISFGSPIAKSLIGKSKGDVASIQLPNGESDFEILDIYYKEICFDEN
ncbi:transcription elongation factor GreA [Helicobacter acinonychis]|uniref:Transcription elongation factor GreA n=1 Tax=Helicobacter acinonychis (strain Sheeba) TaxID=382638 RepID=GREA_HELAH|nr:transcription elongation factor GreA [Helicobacter acinonychis]Q17WJ3.1 RecName: Full=Transcription elongation factor GreA; AltName: Full=Transcript cleavage factor GreA [Helicobacter acinonychis str. Sheeba]CAJ99983.1 greA [Helicobacter acinonychis str. Sheeba]STP04530.1 transcription elongation factor GreA [Helicobacter acinonychis]